MPVEVEIETVGSVSVDITLETPGSVTAEIETVGSVELDLEVVAVGP